MKARDDLAVGVDKLYTQLEKAQDNVKALNATIALSEELYASERNHLQKGWQLLPKLLMLKPCLPV